MKLIVNTNTEEYNDNGLTISRLLEIKKIPAAACAIAVNDRLVKAPKWESTLLADGDRITIISAAYGG